MPQLEISCHRMKSPVRGRNILSQKEFFGMKTNFLSQKETSYHMKKFLVTARNILSQEENFWH